MPIEFVKVEVVDALLVLRYVSCVQSGDGQGVVVDEGVVVVVR